MTSWAYIYEHPDADPVVDRHVVERGGVRTTLVPVAEAAEAPAVAEQLASEGVTLVELCGGFSLDAAARVAEAVGDRVAVGHVTFAVEAVHAAAAFNTAVEDDQRPHATA
jgi:hypothetical protein